MYTHTHTHTSTHGVLDVGAFSHDTGGPGNVNKNSFVVRGARRTHRGDPFLRVCVSLFFFSLPVTLSLSLFLFPYSLTHFISLVLTFYFSLVRFLSFSPPTIISPPRYAVVTVRIRASRSPRDGATTRSVSRRRRRRTNSCPEDPNRIITALSSARYRGGRARYRTHRVHRDRRFPARSRLPRRVFFSSTELGRTRHTDDATFTRRHVRVFFRPRAH